MAEFVQLHLEESVEELHELKNSYLFTPEEIDTIINRRRAFAYRLKRKAKAETDFLNYIEYKAKLLALIELRRKKRKCGIDPTSGESFSTTRTGDDVDTDAKTISPFRHLKRAQTLEKTSLLETSAERAIVIRIHAIFREALKRYPNSMNLWRERIKFAKSRVAILEKIEKYVRSWAFMPAKKLKSNQNLIKFRKIKQQTKLIKMGKRLRIAEDRVSNVYNDLIGIHGGTQPWVWTEAAEWELHKDFSNMERVRTLLRRALKTFVLPSTDNTVLPIEAKLINRDTMESGKALCHIWQTYLALEVKYYNIITERTQVLHKDTGNDAKELNKGTIRVGNDDLNALIRPICSTVDSSHDDQLSLGTGQVNTSTEFKVLKTVFNYAFSATAKVDPDLCLALYQTFIPFPTLRKSMNRHILSKLAEDASLPLDQIFAKILLFLHHGPTLECDSITHSGLMHALKNLEKLIATFYPVEEKFVIVRFIVQFLSRYLTRENLLSDSETGDKECSKIICTINTEIEKVLNANGESDPKIWQEYLTYFHKNLEAFTDLGYDGAVCQFGDIISKAIANFGRNHHVWELNLAYQFEYIYTGDNKLTLLYSLFHQSLTQVKESDSLGIWYYMLEQCKASNNSAILAQLTDRALKTLTHPDVAAPVKIFLFNHGWEQKFTTTTNLLTCKDSITKFCYRFYGQRPYSWDLLRHIIEKLASGLDNLVVTVTQSDQKSLASEIKNLIAQLYTIAQAEFGSQEPTVWMHNIEYVSALAKKWQNNGQSISCFPGGLLKISNIDLLYKKAIKSLRPEHVETFTRLFVLFDTTNFIK